MVSPAEHLDHTYKVSMSVVRRIMDEGAKPSPRGINLTGRVILLLGRICVAAEMLERLSGGSLFNYKIQEALGRLSQALDTLPLDAVAAIAIADRPAPEVRWPHALAVSPLVHTKHHLRIVDEILET